ncbi:tripartite tricarboxylate transporter TctB family protein, partial [Vibrio parahaemolyticus V-223/04]
KRAAPF